MLPCAPLRHGRLAPLHRLRLPPRRHSGGGGGARALAPWAAAWLAKYNAFPAKPPASVSVARRRAAFAALAGGDSLDFCAVVRDVLAPLPPPSAQARQLRVYSASTTGAPAPTYLYLHGGGWHVGSLSTHEAACRRLAAASGCTVAALDYRLAPEHCAPAGLDDAVAALRWLAQAPPAVTAALGIDASRVGVAGDSAGAHLAACAALALRGDAAAPRALALIYPALDLALAARRGGSLDARATGFYLHKDAMLHYARIFLGALPDDDPRLSPLRASDSALAALPPTFISTAGYDPLRDDGDEFARRLRAVGVKVTTRCEMDLPHVWMHLAAHGGGADVVARTQAIGRDMGALLGAHGGANVGGS